jgi:hypothetical protein
MVGGGGMSRRQDESSYCWTRTNKVGFEKALVAKLLIDYVRTDRTLNETSGTSKARLEEHEVKKQPQLESDV